MKKYLNKSEVAERYGVSIHTVTAWTRLNYIPFFRAGRLIRFCPSRLDTWDQEKAIEGRSEITPSLEVA